jgi:hypothetical protein
VTSLGRTLVAAGILLIVLGIILGYPELFSGLRLGRLPGDISVRRGNFSFYFPLTTCILVSVVLTLICYLFKK